MSEIGGVGPSQRPDSIRPVEPISKAGDKQDQPSGKRGLLEKLRDSIRRRSSNLNLGSNIDIKESDIPHPPMPKSNIDKEA